MPRKIAAKSSVLLPEQSTFSPTIIRKESTRKIKDTTIPSLNLLGITVSGLHPKLIDDARLRLELPLTGNGRISMGQNKDAHLNIKKGTKALVDVELAKNNAGQLAVSSFSLCFTRSVKIYNPVASLTGNHGHRRFGQRLVNGLSTELKDRIADLWIKKISVDKDGRIEVDAFVKAAHLVKKRIHPTFEKIKMPVIDESWLDKFGLIGNDSGNNDENKNKQLELLKKLDLTNLLPKLGAASEQGTYNLEVNGKNSAVSVAKDIYQLKGPKEPLKMSLNGTIDLDRQCNLLISIDEQQSTIRSSFGQFSAGGKLKMQNIVGKLPIAVDLKGNISGESHHLHLDTISKQAIKDVMPRRRKQENHATYSDYNTSFGAESVQVGLNGHLSMAISRQGQVMYSTARGALSMGAQNAYAKSNDRGLSLDGELHVSMNLQDMKIIHGIDSPEAKGEMRVAFNPSAKIKRRYPGLSMMEQVYGFNLYNDGTARITPPAQGAMHFLSPVRNLVGFKERVDTSFTRAKRFPIGSAQYFEHIREMTGFQVNRADSIQLLVDGIQSMPERLRIIENAKESICFQTLTFKSDESGWAYAHALVDAKKRGVRVLGIIDSLGNIASLSELEKPNSIYEFLRQNGVELFIFNSFVEDALRDVFQLVSDYPTVFQIHNPQSMKSISEVLNFFTRVIEVAEDRSFTKLAHNEKLKLHHSLHKLFGGLSFTNPQPSINEIKRAVKHDKVPFDALLNAIKRMGDMSHRWHEKYLVVDGKDAIMGGMNIADEYLKGGSLEPVVIAGKSQPAWRDTDVYLTGPVVSDVYESFRRNWQYVAHETLPKVSHVSDSPAKNGIPVTILQHRPLIEGDHHVTNFLLYNLRTLKKGDRAWFETAYFLPRGVLCALQKELVESAKRGVDVRILTNSQTTSDFGPLVEASVFDERELLEAGARIYHRNQERMVHSKVMVIGDNLSMIGSWNMDNRSAAHDSEAVCAVYDEAFNQKLAEVLTRDMVEQSDEITIDKIAQRKLFDEVKSAAYLMASELI